MSAGPKYEYHWADGQTVKKPIKCSAPKYIDYLMTWVQDQLDDEALFPSKIGKVLRVKAQFHFCAYPLDQTNFFMDRIGEDNSVFEKCQQMSHL